MTRTFQKLSNRKIRGCVTLQQVIDNSDLLNKFCPDFDDSFCELFIDFVHKRIWLTELGKKYKNQIK